MATFRELFLKAKHNYTDQEKQDIINYVLSKYKNKETKEYKILKQLLNDFVYFLPPLKVIKDMEKHPDKYTFEIPSLDLNIIKE